MINVTNGFRNEVFVQDNRSYIYNIRITFQDSTYIDISNSDLMENGGVVIDEAVSTDDNLGVGSCVVNKLSIALKNYNGEYDSYDFRKANVVLKIGLLVNGQLEQFQRGIYIVAEPPLYNASVVTLVCYDYMMLTETLLSDVTITYPATVSTIINSICTACNIQRVSQSLPFDSLSVAEDPSTGTMTCREMLAYIAQINGMNCRFNPMGQLEFVWFSNGFSSGDVSWNNQVQIPAIYGLDIAKFDTVVTGIRVVVPQTISETSTEEIKIYDIGTSDYLVSIENNPLVTDANANSVLTSLSSKLLGFRYRKANVSHLGMPWMCGGDSAIVADSRGVAHNIIVSATVFTALGRQSTTSAGASPAINTPSRFSEETTQYVNTINDIKPTIQSLGQRIANAGGLYETRVTDQQGAVITYLHNKENLSESDIQLMVSDVGVLVTANGTSQTPTWYGLTVDGNLIANILQANGINADWINAGALVIYDNDGNELFRADKTNKIFRWKTDRSQMDEDGSITLMSKWDEQQGGDFNVPAFTSVRDRTYYNSAGYAVELIRTTIKYGEGIVLDETRYNFTSVANYEEFLETGDTTLSAYTYSYTITFNQTGIKAVDNQGHTYCDMNWLLGGYQGGGQLNMGGMTYAPFYASYYNGQIAANSNMNSLRPGTYYCTQSNASTVTNTPFSTEFQCCVYWGGDIAFQYAWTKSATSVVKYRVGVSSSPSQGSYTWGAWITLAKTTDIPSIPASHMAFQTGKVTIAAGTSATKDTVINFVSGLVPSGKTAYGIAVTLSANPLPYANTSGAVVTWVKAFSNTSVTISNKTTAWTNYNYYITVFYN